MNDETMTPAAWAWVGAIVLGMGSAFVAVLVALFFGLVWISGGAA